MSRKITNLLLEMIEEGALDKDTVINACFKYMSEDDVKDMAEANDFLVEDDENLDDDTVEEDENEDPLGDWYDTSNEFL